MVLLSLPPPKRGVSPVYRDLPIGTTFVRTFDPTRHNTEALTFRFNGPRARFGHHRGDGPDRIPVDDPERAVYAIAKCDHRQSQPWSRYFYEIESEYGAVDGLIYYKAHNDEPAVMLYERAQTALVCHDDVIVRLDHPALQPLLDDLMRENHLTL